MTTDSSHISLAPIFASSSLPLVLRTMVLEPEREFYQRELERLTGVHLRQVQRDLGRLSRAGLVEERSHGNRRYYRVVKTHPALAELTQLMVKTVGLADVLRAALQPLADDVAVAFVYGSFARGDQTSESDVDLFVVGGVSRRALAAALLPAARGLGREVNPSLFSREEYHDRWTRRDHFVHSVLAEPRIWAIGDESTLAALA